MPSTLPCTAFFLNCSWLEGRRTFLPLQLCRVLRIARALTDPVEMTSVVPVTVETTRQLALQKRGRRHRSPDPVCATRTVWPPRHRASVCGRRDRGGHCCLGWCGRRPPLAVFAGTTVRQRQLEAARTVTPFRSHPVSTSRHHFRRCAYPCFTAQQS